MDRRTFLSTSLAAFVPPSERITLGVIGVGGMGTGHVRAFVQQPEAQVVAVCDVRKEHRDNAARLVNEKYGDNGCKTYSDYRELIARPDIDAIVMACPDHWHALIGLEAARNGKHMYYEKPMSLSIAENKAMRAAIQRYPVVFLFGTQQRSYSDYRFACELVRNGRLGKLHTISIGTATAPFSPDLPAEPVPDGFDYDMWLGQAPYVPYNSRRCTRDWTHIYDYSLGCLSSAWGIHDVDIAQWALDADNTGPVEVEATGEFPKTGLFDTARSFDAILTYRSGVRLRIMDMPTALQHSPQFRLQWMSMLFEGSGGWLLVSRNGMHAHPRSLLREVIGPNEIQLPRTADHRKHFLDCIKTRATPIAPLEAAIRSDTVCQLADISMRLQRKLRWDPGKEEFINDTQANRRQARPMRAPWRI